MKKFLLLLPVVLVLGSCHSNRIYEQFVSLPDSWNSNNVLHFNVDITDTAQAYNVYIAVRNTGKYAYSNLYLFVTAHSPNGHSLRDTVEVTLADEHGKWLGKGAASVFTRYYPYKTNIRFPTSGIYTFDIEQAMWIRELKNINDIGFMIEKAESRH
jgi:gliding motility-associated lipoprotein GldH